MTQAVLHNKTSLTPQTELKHTPFFAQEKYQCGPAALATVLHSQDNPTHPDDLTEKVYIPEKQGSVPIEIIATARSYERLVYPLDASLQNLLREVAAGHPVLVMQNLAFSWQPQWHYAVVVGYDLEKSSVTLRSGTEKRRIIPLATFERTWRRANYWALVILPPTQVPATAQVPRYLKAAQDLETTGHSASATQAYQTAIKTWPDNNLPWLALGNAYYAQGDFKESEKAFRQALQQHSTTAALWNNLGYALLAQGCQKQALSAAQCAIQQQPENTDYHHSFEEITKATDTASSQCRPIHCPP